MTHDELLKLIDFLPLDGMHASFQPALRAVMELHKPVQSYMFEDEACEFCSAIDDNTEILYPCPTIKAIEKELG